MLRSEYPELVSIPEVLPQSRAELRVSRQGSPEVGRRRRHPRRPLLRHGRHLGDEARVLRGEPESRRGGRPPRGERGAGGRLQRLPARGTAAQAEDGAAFVPPGADSQRRVCRRAAQVRKGDTMTAWCPRKEYGT